MIRKLSIAIILLVATSRPAMPAMVDAREKLRRTELDLVGRFGWGPERAKIPAKPAARPTVGTRRDFWAYDFDAEKFYQVSATCRGVGENAYIFVENEQWNLRVEAKDVEAMLTAFDRRIPADPDRGIYRIDVDAFEGGVLHPKSWTVAKATNRGYISRGPTRGWAMSTRKYSPEFKARVALESLRADITQAELCRRYGVASDQVSRWRKKLIEQAPKLFSDGRKDPHLERIAQLEQLVGRLTLELEILLRFALL